MNEKNIDNDNNNKKKKNNNSKNKFRKNTNWIGMMKHEQHIYAHCPAEL